MATTSHTTNLVKKHFEHDLKYTEDFLVEIFSKTIGIDDKEQIKKTMRALQEEGLIQEDGLYEAALEEASNRLIRESIHGQDYTNGDDAKQVTVRTASKGCTYSAPVRGVHTKKGFLLVKVWERIHDQFYYFKIPYSAYKNISRTSNIEIPFEPSSGLPRRSNHWWQHEVISFEDLAN